uniref:tRNA carboxymethyluridine synthase n=1 Tax=viral metagenome TaxID=1070528 RepID=A0A6C0F4F3_9ZZZZ
MDDLEDQFQDQTLINFVKELSLKTFTTEEEYQKAYKETKKTHKLCPSKPIIRKTYNYLLSSNQITPNHNLLNFTLKKKSRSSSGVSVITILTSPTPEYTDSTGKLVKQSFSCGKSCAYCPNEPEIHINLKITDINFNINRLFVKTEEDIHLIRMLTYIIHSGIKYDVSDCYHFTDTTFTIQLVHEFSTDTFTIGDKIEGVKGEQPRSYISSEPAVLRANRNNFNPIIQVYDRVDALLNCGHNVDKIEILVLGGTWDHYPLEYQKEFIRDTYYSINSLVRRGGNKLTLEEEIKYAETSEKRIIGLTLETRPDCINLRQIKKLREFNVTRLQIGVQHIDDDILQYIERGCSTDHTVFGNYLWKQNGGKIDWHLMPDLPGSSLQKDIDMFEKIFAVNNIDYISKNYYRYDLKHPELQADQLKIYPCTVVDWTKIKEWYEQGIYKPYAEDEDKLIEVIKCIKQNIFPWIRLNRIVRDIPNINIIGGNSNVNLRQKIQNDPTINCPCIRCREVKNNTSNISEAELFIREYNGIRSTEFFISFESPDQKILYGFLRLRINHTTEDLIYPELEGCSFIRELHVYGSIVNHFDKTNGKSAQHMGFGKKLMKQAEIISLNYGIQKVAVISGVGVREYYGKLGYHLENNYMVKDISFQHEKCNVFEVSLVATMIIIILSIIYDIFS